MNLNILIHKHSKKEYYIPLRVKSIKQSSPELHASPNSFRRKIMNMIKTTLQKEDGSKCQCFIFMFQGHFYFSYLLSDGCFFHRGDIKIPFSSKLWINGEGYINGGRNNHVKFNSFIYLFTVLIKHSEETILASIIVFYIFSTNK